MATEPTDFTASNSRVPRSAGKLNPDDAIALPQVEAWLLAKVDAMMTASVESAEPAATDPAATDPATDPAVAAVAVGAAARANTALSSAALPTLRRRARKPGHRKAG